MASSQQQAESAPEDAWISYIQAMYPDLLRRTYFFPPFFFNRVPHTVETIAGQTVRVATNPQPQQQRCARQNPPPPPSSAWQSRSPAGIVFTENPAGLQDQHIKDSECRKDEAQYQCLQALENIMGTMIIISNMMFRNYLDNQHNPQHHINPTNIISQLPSITHPSIPPNIADGGCDILILHRQYGILVGEVKGVGGQNLSPADQDRIVAKVVMKTIAQLDNMEIAIKHLVHDMGGGNIRVTKMVLLPNITSAQLTAAVNSSQQLQQALVRCTTSQDVAQAISRCLCSDDLQLPLSWWSSLWTVGPDPSMSDTTYERLAARFCGPASTVDIPTPGSPRRVLRTFGEAVAETSMRYSSLVLTPQQVALLNRQPEPSYMYLQGPPGCGQGIVLLLKALQLARQGEKIIIVGNPASTAKAILMEEQLCRKLGAAGAAPAGSLHRHNWNMDDINDDVSALTQLLGTGTDPKAFILLVGAPDDRDSFLQWLGAVRHRLPTVMVWGAGLHRLDNDPTRPPPSWLEICTVTEPLRCPPAVTRAMETSGWIDGDTIPRYSAPALPLPTEGPPVRRLQHRGQPGHSHQGQPWECSMCTDAIGHILTAELRVGQPGAPQYRDSWILCHGLHDAQSADILVRGLSGRHGVPVRAVPCPPSDADARDLALALTDQVIVTDGSNMEGMERAVVIALGTVYGHNFQSWSTSTSFLSLIDCTFVCRGILS